MKPRTAFTSSQTMSRQVAGSASVVRSHIRTPGIGGFLYGRGIGSPRKLASMVRWQFANHRVAGTNTSSSGIPTQTAISGTATTLSTKKAIPSSARMARNSAIQGCASLGNRIGGALVAMVVMVSPVRGPVRRGPAPPS